MAPGGRRPHESHREIRVIGGEQPRRETREGREVQRGQDASGVHVLNPLMHVITARADLIQALRLKAVLVLRPPRHRVQRRIRDYRVPQRPHVAPVITVHPPRALSPLPPPHLTPPTPPTP